MVKSSPPLKVVCDTGPLIHLDELGCIDLLQEFTVFVPDVVWKEVLQHRPAALEQSVTELVFMQVAFPYELGLQTLARALALDAGELAALALMHQHPGAILLTDDTAARLAAEQLGMPAHGTIGILLRAIRRNLRTPKEVLALLETLPDKSTLHIRPALLETIIAYVRQELEL